MKKPPNARSLESLQLPMQPVREIDAPLGSAHVTQLSENVSSK